MDSEWLTIIAGALGIGAAMDKDKGEAEVLAQKNKELFLTELEQLNSQVL